MNQHWRNKRERTESTAFAVNLGDAYSRHSEGVRANLEIAGVHFGKWSAYMGADPITIRQQTNAGIEEFNKVEGLCESAIERRILPWLIYEDYGHGHQVARTYNYKTAQAPFRTPVLIVPQFAILRFRVDFMVIVKDDAGRCSMIAVECDGFDFHEVQRDQQRDGHLAMLGVKTVRASGESITADPRSVSGRVAEIAMLARE
jgi:very-short-patch-repair endonuclease